MEWFVYIIQASDKRLYTGITTDVTRRWSEHLGDSGGASPLKGKGKGAKFFRGRKPKQLMYVEERHDRSSASRREAAIKKLSRSKKLELLEDSSNKVEGYRQKLVL